jgi:hypothetical protein
MHPDGGEHDDIESLATGDHHRQTRQTIVDPFDRRRRMQRHGAYPELCRRLHGHDSIAMRVQPARIGPGPGADVEHRCRRLGQQAQDGLVLMGKAYLFVLHE